MKPNRLVKTVAHLAGILIVLALAWTLRLRAVERLPIDYDEDDYLRAGQQFAYLIRTGNWSGFLNTNYRPEHPPLAKIAYGLAILDLPEEPLIADVEIEAKPASSLPESLLQRARTVAAVFGTLTAGLLALLNPLGGLFLAINTWTIKYTSQVMLDGLSALLSLSMVLAYVRYKKTHKTGWLVGSAVLLGLAADSKFLHGTIGFAVLIDWFLDAKRNNDFAEHPFGVSRYYKRAFLWGLLSLVIFFIANPYLWPDPLGRLRATLDAVSYTATNPNVENAGYVFWQQLNWLSMSVPWQLDPPAFVIMADTFIAILAVIGFRRLWDSRRVFAIWLVLGLVVLLLWRTKWPQYLLVLTVPLALAAAEGAGVIWQGLLDWWRERKAVPATISTKSDLRRALPWLVPGLIAFAVLTLFPLFFQFAVSLTDFNATSIRDGFQGGIWRAVWGGLTGQIPAMPVDIGTRSNQVNYVGLEAYPAVFTFITGSPDGWSILFFNILWTILSVLFQGALGLAVALLLWQRGVRLEKFWQTLFILPWAIPEMIGATMWLNVFQRDWGWLSLAADKYGPGSIPGLLLDITESSSGLWLITFLLPAIWYGFPFMMLAASVGLKAIPRNVFDAAAIDGANIFQTFRYITWPLLLPLLLPAVIIRGIFAFNQFYLFQVFFFQDATLATLSYNVFNPSGFNSSGQFAISATINIISVIILIGFIVLFNRWSKAEEGVSYA
jgi:ABC-type sugar transport system permease subunit